MIQVPNLYEGESLYGLFTRIYNYNTVENCEELVEICYGRKGKALLIGQKGIDFFSKNILHNIKSEISIINEYSIIGYLIKFNEKEYKNKLKKDIRENTNKPLFIDIGTININSIKPKFMKLCSRCCEEELIKYGEVYWKRDYLINGYNVCLKHNEQLLRYNLVDAAEIRPLLATDAYKLYHPKNEEYRNLKLLKDITRNIDYLIYNTKDINIDLLRSACYEKLKEMGYVSLQDKIYFSGLYRDFNKYYGDSLFKYFNLIVNKHELKKVLNRSDRRGKKVKTCNPLLMVLLIKFLFGSTKVCIESIGHSYKFLLKEKYPCLNKFCRHYKDDVIDNIKINVLYSKKKKTRVMYFKCYYCGFCYRRGGPDKSINDTYKYSETVDYGRVWMKRFFDAVVKFQLYHITYIADFMDVSPSVVYRLLKKYNLTKYTSTKVYYGVRSEKKVSKKGELLDEYKKQLIEYINNNPNYTRYNILEVMTKQYYYILRYDKKWIDDNTIKFKNAYKIAKETRIRKQKLKMEEEDYELLKKLKEYFNKSTDKSKRSTIKSICSDVGINYKYVIEKKYPLTNKYLKDYLSLANYKKNKI